jgi:hypothetical protein
MLDGLPFSFVHINRFEAHIEILLLNRKRKKYVVKGDWTDRLTCYRAETTMTRKGSKRGKTSIENSSIAADSFSTSSSDCSLELNNPVVLWTFNSKPPHSKEVGVMWLLHRIILLYLVLTSLPLSLSPYLSPPSLCPYSFSPPSLPSFPMTLLPTTQSLSLFFRFGILWNGF